MGSRFSLSGIEVDVVRKNIKNIHLSVNPPDGRVRIAAPERTNMDTLRVFAISKLPWIKQQQRKLRSQDREPPREYLDRESHHVWGKRHLLRIIEIEAPPTILLRHRTLDLLVRPGTTVERRQEILDAWYRDQLKAVVPEIIAKWSPRLDVAPQRYFLQRMKTKWGSCNTDRRTIRLNTELAKKPPRCLEYVIVHEMSHLIEGRHNDRFIGLLNHHLPQWRATRELLNEAPL